MTIVGWVSFGVIVVCVVVLVWRKAKENNPSW